VVLYSRMSPVLNVGAAVMFGLGILYIAI